MPKVKTIILSGEETAVKFSDGYPYYIITNLGDNEIYASGNPDITAYADGVYTILPGMETRISPEKSADTVYLLGSGMVQVRAEEIAVPTSFRAVSKGGDKNEPQYLIVNELPEVGNEKYTYLVPVDDYLSDNKYVEYIWVSGEWEKVGTPTMNISMDYENLSNAPSYWTNDVSLPGTTWEHVFSTEYGGDTFAAIVFIKGIGSDSLVGVFNISNTIPSFKVLSHVGNKKYISKIRVVCGANKKFELDFYKTINGKDNYKAGIIVDPFSLTEVYKENFVFELKKAATPASNATITEFDVDDIDTALSATSENPVQNMVITEALANKVDNDMLATSTSNGLITAEDKIKLDSITPEMLEKLANL